MGTQILRSAHIEPPIYLRSNWHHVGTKLVALSSQVMPFFRFHPFRRPARCVKDLMRANSGRTFTATHFSRELLRRFGGNKQQKYIARSIASYLTSSTIAATTDRASVMFVPMMPLGPRRAQPLQYMPGIPSTLPLHTRTTMRGRCTLKSTKTTQDLERTTT